nr:hypothetical protein B0A51_08581 [Rachicladosporium sp. CCFEE 5018]
MEKVRSSVSDDKQTNTPGAHNAHEMFSWTRPQSWDASSQLAPVAVALVVAFVSIYWNGLATISQQSGTSVASCRADFNYTFPVDAVQAQGKRLAAHDWEYGTLAQALLELHNPEMSVFSATSFPADKIPSLSAGMPDALSWVQPKIRTSGDTLYQNDLCVGDPASLGVATILLGQQDPDYLLAASRQKHYLLNKAPRFANGAISHRVQDAEIWADAISMFPPFLAYYAVVSNDLSLMREAVEQCRLYRQIMKIDHGPQKGLWQHIVGHGEIIDGAWSTSAGWAAHGMARVRASISGWEPSNETMHAEIHDLDEWIGEILDGAINNDDNESGLLRNYLGDESWWGETSGAALLAATAYRMAVQSPTRFAQAKYSTWADAKRQAVFSHVDPGGRISPAVNPLQHTQREPINESPEGASFTLMLGAAWRDCVCAGTCSQAT